MKRREARKKLERIVHVLAEGGAIVPVRGAYALGEYARGHDEVDDLDLLLIYECTDELIQLYEDGVSRGHDLWAPVRARLRRSNNERVRFMFAASLGEVHERYDVPTEDIMPVWTRDGATSVVGRDGRHDCAPPNREKTR